MGLEKLFPNSTLTVDIYTYIQCFSAFRNRLSFFNTSISFKFIYSTWLCNETATANRESERLNSIREKNRKTEIIMRIEWNDVIYLDTLVRYFECEFNLRKVFTLICLKWGQFPHECNIIHKCKSLFATLLRYSEGPSNSRSTIFIPILCKRINTSARIFHLHNTLAKLWSREKVYPLFIMPAYSAHFKTQC